eukprot:SAG11_NODE_8998_length_955_cov_1.080607_1_plen_30_part_01
MGECAHSTRRTLQPDRVFLPIPGCTHGPEL